jgi:hypothetical protein
MFPNLKGMTRSQDRSASKSVARSFTPQPNATSMAAPVRSLHASQQAIMTNVERFVSSELGILAETGDAAVARANPQRLAVFKNGWSMIAPFLSRDVSAYIERMMAEYDSVLAASERRVRESSLDMDRKRIEASYAATFERLRQEQKELLDKRLKELKKAEEALEHRRKLLEEQARDALFENERMKKQHEEDHDRASTMSHAVIDARLAMQIAEKAQAEAERKLRRLEMAENNKLDLMDDLVMLTALLRQNAIPYELKTRYILEGA